MQQPINTTPNPPEPIGDIATYEALWKDMARLPLEVRRELVYRVKGALMVQDAENAAKDNKAS